MLKCCYLISGHKMKRRWQQSLLLITLIASQSLSSFARQIPPPQKHLQSLHHQRPQWQQQRQQHFENQPGYKVKHHYVVNWVSFCTGPFIMNHWIILYIFLYFFCILLCKPSFSTWIFRPFYNGLNYI